MNTLASYITNAINNGEPLELEQLNWQAITDNWSCDTLCSIIDKLDSIENVKRVENSIMKLKGYGKISPPDRFINELTNRCIFRYAAMEWEQRRGVSSSVNNSKAEPPATNTIDERLTKGDVKKILDALEGAGYCAEWRAGKKKRLCAVACRLIQEKVEGEFRPTNGTYEFRPFEKYFGLKRLAKTYGNIENIESVKEHEKVKKIIDKVMP